MGSCCWPHSAHRWRQGGRDAQPLAQHAIALRQQCRDPDLHSSTAHLESESHCRGAVCLDQCRTGAGGQRVHCPPHSGVLRVTGAEVDALGWAEAAGAAGGWAQPAGSRSMSATESKEDRDHVGSRQVGDTQMEDPAVDWFSGLSSSRALGRSEEACGAAGGRQQRLFFRLITMQAASWLWGWLSLPFAHSDRGSWSGPPAGCGSAPRPWAGWLER